ncbi:MAG: hypothetical protein LQ349_003176 [Xanthoria aureola]|nr:MAG: hypothetical protein LQ349_003176 [Xanthoria aureola]
MSAPSCPCCCHSKGCCCHSKGNIKILVAPSGFKESLEPQAAANAIEAGILRADPTAKVTKAPLVDGGEGFVEALVSATKGTLQKLTVMGPVRQPVSSHYGFLGGCRGKTAVIEMAAAAGLRLVPQELRDPTSTTTFGVGETIAAALEAGAEEILIGCGDSGTCDAGVGMAQALGVRFYDIHGDDLPLAAGGASLNDLAIIDRTERHHLLRQVPIHVACNWHNVLCGPEGVARVFGPQKGATASDVDHLARAMDKFASACSFELGVDVGQAPGSGASGGLGAGLMLIGAQLHPRYDIIMPLLDIDPLLADCHLVFTAEGSIDFQTPRGKIPAEVAMRAKARGLPVVALAGTIGEDANVNYGVGIDAFASILQRPVSLETAIAEAERLLAESAESAMRMIMIGRSLQKKSEYDVNVE